MTVTTVATVDHAQRRAGIIAVLTACIFWSFGSVLAKSADAEGMVVTFWRMWMAVVVLGLIAALAHGWPTWAELRRSVVAGVLFAANIALFFTALEHMSVASALVIAALAPVLMLPVAVRFLGEHLTPVKIACAVVAVAGVVVSVIATPSSGDDGDNLALGSLLATSALVLWVGYLVAAKRVRGTVDTVPFMFSVTVVAALTMSVVVAVARPELGQVEDEGWLWILLLTLGPGILGHGLLAWSQPRVDASVSTVLIQAEPVGAAIAAYFLLDESVSLVQGLSMGVVIVALCMLAVSEARDTRLPHVEPQA